MVFTFSVLDQKNPFGQIWSKKSKLPVKAEIWYQETNFWICGIQWWCKLFQFLTKNTFLCKFDWKNKNCQFEPKLRTRLIWICRIMQKICGVHFFCFRPEKPFWVNLVKKIKIVSFKLKFSTKTNLNKCNLMMFTFSVFVHKYLSWANLVQKFKLACSKWIWYKD